MNSILRSFTRSISTSTKMSGTHIHSSVNKAYIHISLSEDLHHNQSNHQPVILDDSLGCRLFLMANSDLLLVKRVDSSRTVLIGSSKAICIKIPSFTVISPLLQHPICRHQGLHSFVHEPVGTGSGSNPQRALWTL